jgi:hypothetical protein
MKRMNILALVGLSGLIGNVVANDAKTLQAALFHAKGLYSCKMSERPTGVARSWQRAWLSLSSDTSAVDYDTQFSMEAADHSIDTTYNFPIDWTRPATLTTVEGGVGTDHVIRMDYYSPETKKALTLEIRPSGNIKYTITTNTANLSVRCLSW